MNKGIKFRAYPNKKQQNLITICTIERKTRNV